MIFYYVDLTSVCGFTINKFTLLCLQVLNISVLLFKRLSFFQVAISTTRTVWIVTTPYSDYFPYKFWSSIALFNIPKFF